MTLLEKIEALSDELQEKSLMRGIKKNCSQLSGRLALSSPMKRRRRLT